MQQQKSIEEEKLTEVSNMTRQIVFSKLAHFCTSTNSDDLYFLYEAVRTLRSDVGNDILKEKYKKEYEEINKKLLFIGSVLYKVKLYYDSLTEKKLDDSTKQKKIRELYRKELSKINPIQYLIYDVFYLYIKNTNLRHQTIPNEFFKKSERKYTTFDLKGKQEEEEDTEDEE